MHSHILSEKKFEMELFGAALAKEEGDVHHVSSVFIASAFAQHHQLLCFFLLIRVLLQSPILRSVQSLCLSEELHSADAKFSLVFFCFAFIASNKSLDEK